MKFRDVILGYIGLGLIVFATADGLRRARNETAAAKATIQCKICDCHRPQAACSKVCGMKNFCPMDCVQLCDPSRICPQDPHHTMPDGAQKSLNIAPMSDEDLAAWYAGYNEVYFLNQLPHDVDIQWADLTDQKDMGLSDIPEHGRAWMRLDRASNPVPRQAKMTELHEMCHFKVGNREFNPHGPLWRDCMVGLANKGAMDDLW
jgi:hypothetical protein